MGKRKVYGRKTEYSGKITALVCVGVAALLGIIIGVCFLLPESTDSSDKESIPEQTAFYPQDYYPEALQDGEIAFMANGEMGVLSGQTSLPLYLEYPAVNTALLQAELWNGEECLYRSDTITPGSLIEQASLEEELPVGKYRLTLRLTAFDSKDGKKIGTSEEFISVTVSEDK